MGRIEEPGPDPDAAASLVHALDTVRARLDFPIFILILVNLAAVRALVVVATPIPWLQSMRRLATLFAVGVSRLFGRFPARLVGLGPEDELGGVMVQWMTWQLEGHWRGDDGTDYEALLTALDLPMLFVAGAGDRVEAPPAAVHALFQLTGSRDRTFLLCGRDSGFSEDFGHATILVSRAARDEVWPRIVDWIRRTAGS